MADILVIDDDLLISQLIELILIPAGHSVRTAATGLNGIKEIRRTVPDLILLDMNMPEMDGYTVAKALRAGSTAKTVPIIAVTAHTSTDDYDASYAAGCTGFIAKPFNAERLLQVVAEQLGPRR